MAVGSLLRGSLGWILGVRAFAVPVAGVGYHDDVWLELFEVGVVQPPATHNAGGIVFHEDVQDSVAIIILQENGGTILRKSSLINSFLIRIPIDNIDGLLGYDEVK